MISKNLTISVQIIELSLGTSETRQKKWVQKLHTQIKNIHNYTLSKIYNRGDYKKFLRKAKFFPKNNRTSIMLDLSIVIQVEQRK